MAIDDKTFVDGARLKDIREKVLNPTVAEVNRLTPKVDVIEALVKLGFKDVELQSDAKKMTLTKKDDTQTELDFQPWFDEIVQTIDVQEDGRDVIAAIEKIKIKGGIVTESTDGGKHTATIEIPNPTIIADTTGADEAPITKISLKGNKGTSQINGTTLEIDLPEGGAGGGDIQGKVGDTTATIKTVEVVGNTTDSIIVGDKLQIHIPDANPGMTGEVDGKVGATAIDSVKVMGNVGSSTVNGKTLEVNIPKSRVKIDSGTLTPYNSILLSGETTDCSVAGGEFKLNIPKRLSVQVEGKAPVDNVSTLVFDDAILSVNPEGDKAKITHKKLQGKLGTTEMDISSVELSGTLGGSTLVDGKLVIDLPAGGGGGGSTIYGEVNGVAASPIDRVLVSGNTEGSNVTGSILEVVIPQKIKAEAGGTKSEKIDKFEFMNATLRTKIDGKDTVAVVDIPRPQAQVLTSGWQDFKGIAITGNAGSSQVLNEVLTIDLPSIEDVETYFKGFFESVDALDKTIPLNKRIRDRTCAYITLGGTDKWVLHRWSLEEGQTDPHWNPTKAESYIKFQDAGVGKQLLGINKNPMFNIDVNGIGTITDCTISKLPFSITDSTGVESTKGNLLSLSFEDGDQFTSYDTTTKNVTLKRSQQRLALGGNPDTVSGGKYATDRYEGSLFLNTSDHSWWGYADKGVAAGKPKWTKVIHANMSDQVMSLDNRVPQFIPTITTVDAKQDHASWKYSGWTKVDKKLPGLPDEYQNRFGGYIQTFASMEGDVLKRSQLLHIDDVSVTFKRYWAYASGQNNWTSWQQVSFSADDLRHHNNDASAHKQTAPFYKTLAFDCTYKELYDNHYQVPKTSFKLLGSSNGVHQNAGEMVTIPYDETFRIRGHIYFHHTGAPNTSIPGTWTIQVEKQASGTAGWVRACIGTFVHATTTLNYLPLKWDFQNINLKKGDDLRLSFSFAPSDGTTSEEFARKYATMGFFGSRSYISIDIQGNDGGSAVGEMFRTILGNFASVGDAAAITFRDTPSSPTRVVGAVVNNTIGIFS